MINLELDRAEKAHNILSASIVIVGLFILLFILAGGFLTEVVFGKILALEFASLLLCVIIVVALMAQFSHTRSL